jgi:ATP-dependent helicase/nuclease subunit A
MSRGTKEQLEVIFHNKGNILVSASAGSGKTHTMIERIKRLVIEEGVGISEILAVTFTESAASDMKDKIRVSLSEKVEDSKVDRLKQLVEDLPTADICTMHSFCGKLIRNYFFVCGVSPDFKIIDQAEALSMKKVAIEKTFKEFYDQKEEWFVNLVDRHALSRSDAYLKELILSIYSFCDSEANPDELKNLCLNFYTPLGAKSLLRTLKADLDENLLRLKESLVSPICAFKEEGAVKALAFTNTLYSDIEEVIKLEDIYQVKKFDGYKLKLDVERKLSPALLEMKEVITEVRSEFTKLIKRYLSVLGENLEDDQRKLSECKVHTENLIKIVDKFTEIYKKDKLEENVLDFNDLEHFALKVLADENIRETISNKYKFVFIDEYQDTNGVQEKIISYLNSDNLFMVGDVKQSIYGFRGCRSEFFTNKDKKMTEKGEKVVRLNSNFRSAKAVIELVNTVFNFCMTEKVYGENYKGRSELIFGGLYPDGYDGRATLHFLENPPKEQVVHEKARIYDVIKESKEEEGKENLLSSMIANVIESELTKKIYDPKTQEYRRVNFGDIAILTRNRSGAFVSDLVSGLLKHGLPVCSSVAENVLNYPEIKVMINALKLIDCFYQDLPLASTLKSPIGNITDEELFDIVRFYDDNTKNPDADFSSAYAFYIENGSGELKDKLIEFDNYFKNLRLVSDFVGASGALKRLVKDKNIEGYFYAKAGGEAQVERLNKFISASVSGNKVLSVREFLNRIENCPDAFGLSPFSEENTIKVTTIHSSKGLEYPVVIVCGLERNFNDEEEKEEVLLSRDFGLAVKHFDDQKRVKNQTLLRGVIRARMRRERIKEEMRLFYVALTRATYSLHLMFSAKDDRRKSEFVDATSFLDFIPSTLVAKCHSESEVKIESRESKNRKVIILNPDEKIVDKMKENFSYTYQYLAETTLPLKASVTKVNSEALEDFIPTHVLFEEESPNTESGNIAHKILEHYDFNNLEQFDAQIESMLCDRIISDEEIKKVNLNRIKSVILSGVFLDLKNKDLYREKSFLINIEANKIFDTTSLECVTLQGIIDLLIIDGDTARIIDYKYSSLQKESLKIKYKKQLQLYSYAVEKVLNKKVIKMTLVNLFTGETVDID